MYSQRLENLPPYLFARIDALKGQKRREGVDVIDLGVGDPDLPTPAHIVEAMVRAVKNPKNHHYPAYEGMAAYREAVASWYDSRFSVSLDPASEVVALMGSKDGIAHIPEAFVNPGDYVLVPDPGYPVYKTSTLFAEGKIHLMPLLEENSFLPVLEDIPADVLKRAKLLFFNYPNNPTAAIAPARLFDEVVEFAREHDLVVVHDNAYSEITFDGYRAPSFLEADGAKEVGVEMHSLSKTYNMTGWRIGSVVGNADVVAGIGKIKSNIDSGTFGEVQDAGIVALSSPKKVVDDIRKVYQHRIDILYKALKDMGLQLEKPRATLYLWAWVGGSSIEYAGQLLEKTGIVATPGVGFGQYGEGYVRFSITQPTERIEEAAERLEKMS